MGKFFGFMSKFRIIYMSGKKEEWYQMNVKLLKSKMALYGDTIADLAKLIGKSYVTTCNYLKGKTQMSLRDVGKIAKRYKLTPEEIVRIFL